MTNAPRIAAVSLSLVFGFFAGCAVPDSETEGAEGAGGADVHVERHCFWWHHRKHCSGSSSTTGQASSSSASSGSSGSSSSSGPSSSSSSSSSSTGSGGSTPASGLFEKPHPWNTSVATHAKASTSDAIINWLSQNGGWGTGSMKIDFSITLQKATASTPYKAFTTTGDFWSPDCDHVPFPVPAGGALEGESGYACANDGDCHLLVVDPAQKKLYEMWRAFTGSSGFQGGCAAVWDLTKQYPASLRGDGCTSADAGGFPIAAMLFTADEVAAGEIPHAIRFILPNERIRGGKVYVRPATHTTSPTSGGPNAPPYGVRFRLKSSYNLASLPSEGARVVARAMQKYGMFLSDGGNIALTAADDRFTNAKWDDVAVGPSSLSGLKVSDFEVVDMGPTIPYGDCHRNP